MAIGRRAGVVRRDCWRVRVPDVCAALTWAGISGYRVKASELVFFLDANHVSPWIKLPVPRFGEVHRKLFTCVVDSPALRASDLIPGLYPSNLLCELVVAIRALDWPNVRILVHDALRADSDARIALDRLDECEPAHK